MTIFWSWQSDTPGTGRHFVRDVLSDAITELKQTPEVDEPIARDALENLHVDHGREGIPGSPDLARVILAKIEKSSVFVADVTSVGIVSSAKADEKQKKLINANVAIELGYALHALGDRALIMVMNDHYGDRSDLPFDLHAKAGPVMFTLPPDANKETLQKVAKTLVHDLKEALKPYIEEQAKTLRQQSPFKAMEP